MNLTITNIELQQVLAMMPNAVRNNEAESYSRDELVTLFDKAFIKQWEMNRALRT